MARRSTPAAPGLRVAIDSDGSHVTITLRGEIDLDTAPQVLQASKRVEASCTDVQVDVSGVSFCDVVGLNSLLAASRTLTGLGCRLTYLAPPARLTRLICLAGVADELLGSPRVPLPR